MICSVFTRISPSQNFLRLGYPKIWCVTVYTPSKGTVCIWQFSRNSGTSIPQTVSHHGSMARSSLQSQRATEESSGVENKELHKSLEKAKREAWMKLICFFSVFADDGECRNFIYVTLRNMYRMNQNYNCRYVDFFRRCLAYHLQASTEEVSQLKDSIMTAKEECQSLQVQSTSKQLMR